MRSIDRSLVVTWTTLAVLMACSLEIRVSCDRYDRMNKFMERYAKVKVDKHNYDKVHNMHVNWYAISVKALMGQLGRELYKEISQTNKKLLEKCLWRIEDKKDLVQSAKCLIGARNRHQKEWKYEYDKRGMSKMFHGIKTKRLTIDTTRLVMYNEPNTHRRPLTDLQVLREQRRRQRRHRRYANLLSRIPIYDKPETIKVRKVPRLMRLAHRSDKSPFRRVTNLVTSLFRNGTKQKKWTDLYKDVVRMRKTLQDKEREPGARAYNLRMYDLVLNLDRPTLTPKQSKSPEGLVQQAMELFAYVKKDDRDRGNVRVLSPRLAPLMPAQAETSGSILSPTLFALYETNNSASDIAPIPEVLQNLGLGPDERDSVLSMLMEMSGTTGAVEEALALLKELQFIGSSKEMKEATERLGDRYKHLEDSLDYDQKRHIEQKGFAFLNPDQLKNVYRDEEALEHFSDYDNLAPHERTESLWKAVERIAREEPLDKFKTRLRRRKRDLNTPSVLAPVVLAPYMFAPVYGLSVLGPVVLSPSLFSPLILNPSVLGPYVLSPGVGMPFILSPYLLSPYVLSPLIMAPFILNPYVLSPNVINPYVLSPLVLSPLVLCPDVLSPMLLGGNVLSPSVASPAVLTESFLMASVLSPSFLS